MSIGNNSGITGIIPSSVSGGGNVGLVIAIGGQSNAEGNGPPHTGTAESPSPTVTALYKSGKIDVASEPLHTRDDWDIPNYPSGLDPAATGYPCDGFGLRAAKDIAAAIGEKVLVVPCALGSTSMSMWSKPTNVLDRTTLFGALNARVKSVAKKPDLILWSGHESDAAKAVANEATGVVTGTYGAEWLQLVADLRSELGAETPIIYAQLGTIDDAAYTKHTTAGEVQRQLETGYGTGNAVVSYRPSQTPMTSPYAAYTGVSGGNTAAPAPGNDIARVGNLYQIVCTGTGTPQVYLAKHVVGVRYKTRVTAITAGAGIRVANDGAVIATGQTFAPGDVREYEWTAATPGLGVYALNTATDFTFILEEFEAAEVGSVSAHYMVVAHDLPRSDALHMSRAANRELGRRIALCYRERVLKQPVNGTGPRLVSITKPSSTTVKVKFNRTIQTDANNYGDGTNSLFRVYDAGVLKTLSSAVRDPGDDTAVLLTVSAANSGTVCVSYGNRRGVSTANTYRAGCIYDTDQLPAPAFGPIAAT